VPKRLHEIKNFHVGTVTTPVDTDIPEDSATYSLNIDPMAEDGVLKGIPYDLAKNLVSTGSDTSPANGGVASGSSVITLDDSSGFSASGSVIFTDSLGYVQFITYTGNSGGTERLTGCSGWVGAGTLLNDAIVYETTVSETTGALYIASQSAMINNNGTRHIVYFQESDSKIKKIDDFYASPGSPIQASISTAAESVTGTPTMVKNNKEVHIGMGNGSENKPLWCGFHSQGQFGEAASTLLDVEDAELHSPTTFPSFCKTVEYGDYIYGISFDGNYLYYIDKSSKYVVYVSNLIFTKTKAMALDHNNLLMIVDDNNTILWIDISSTDHSVTKTYGITQAGTETAHDFTDIIETGASSTWHIWLAKSGGHTYHGAGQVAAPTTTTGRGLLQNATAPTGTAGTLTFTDRTPFQGIKSSLWGSYNHQVGHWYDSNTTSQGTAPSHTYPANAAIIPYTKASLIKGNDTNWVGWICEFAVEDHQTYRLGINCLINATTSSAVPHQVIDINGPVLNFVKNDYAPVYSGTYGDNDIDETKWFPVRLKTASASTDIIGKYGDDADLTNATLQTTWDNITSIYSHDSGHITDDRIIIAVNTANSGGIASHDTKLMHLKYIDPTPTVSGGATMASNHWFCTGDTSAWAHNTDESVYRFASGGASVPTFEYTTDAAKVQDAIVTSDDTGFTYSLFLNSGYANGKIAIMTSTGTSNFGAWTRKLAAPLDVTLTQTNMENNSGFSASKEYWYKASFIYDGYQEGPLGIATQLISPLAKNVEITMDLYTETLGTRVTGVALYRAESATDGTTEPTGFYRLVDTYDLNVSWKYSTDTTWGATRTKTVIDNYNLGASYEGRTGISEVLDHSIPNYSLSTDLNSHLFVAKCHHQLIKDANNYLFKSKPYKYDQFNWINDFLVLPTTPTALKSFNGRVYAFDENNMYRIEPNNLYIEDTLEGVGCVSQDSISVSDYGMCFADKNNIYLNNGTNSSPISIAISKGDSTYSWENVDITYSPKVMFYNKMKSFVIVFKTTSGVYATWAYNVIKKRWDLWRNFMIYGGSQDTNEPISLILGKDGELIASCNSKMWTLMNDPTNVKPWDWHSKKLTLGQDTQIKRFNNFNVTGSPSGSLGHASTGIAVKIDGTLGTEAGSLTSFTVAADEQSGKHLQWILSGQTSTVDALGTIYRRKIVTSEQ